MLTLKKVEAVVVLKVVVEEAVLMEANLLKEKKLTT